ncbi:RNA exonuclease [Lasiodiplodia theobromae]|uniref:RNA exonuclease n=1 Tax=Lasiodiplodia theobromae TaxID=45133 RepID=UPI0015C3B567|nr:RNA exonuclease [Lasiodiplodia theobromae]KAF4535034.1 RNA exonuclease [Lasiodiplodia theobromae]
MGTAASGDSELIRVTLVDYFTSDVLLDSLVFPSVPMRDLRSRFSGVTWSELYKARKARTCIFGRENARKAVWKFVGPNTIVVGHSAYNDLLALRWAHTTVVDTYYLDALQPPKLDIKDAEDVKQASSDSNENEPTTTSACASDPKRVPKRPSPKSLKGMALDKLGREIQTAGKQGHDSLEDAIATRDLARWVVYNAQV